MELVGGYLAVEYGGVEIRELFRCDNHAGEKGREKRREDGKKEKGKEAEEYGGEKRLLLLLWDDLWPIWVGHLVNPD